MSRIPAPTCKMGILIFVALFALSMPGSVLGQSKHAASDTSDSITLIMPGHSIGPIYLGMPRPTVQMLLGEPSKAYAHDWGNRYDYDQDNLKLMVVFTAVPGDAVQQLATDSTTFATAEGVRVGSTGTDVVNAYGSAYRRTVNGTDTQLQYPHLGIGFWLTSNNVVRDLYVMKTE